MKLQKVKDMERPKKPASGFLRFLSEEFKKFEVGTNNYRDFQRKIAQDWKVLPEDKKKVYNDECKKDSEVYKLDLAKWELKMIRLGHTDIVRNETLIDSEDRPKKVRAKEAAKKNKAESSDSDWKLGWCQNSLPDAEHFKISLSEHQQDHSISSHPSKPPELTLSDDKNERHEMKQPPSASEGEKDTTSDEEIIKNSKPPIVPPPSSSPPAENQPASKGTLDKLKKFFKF
jgi:HMG (high mobility group) box